MTIREETEAIERQTLSRYATLSENSLGRRVPLDNYHLGHHRYSY